MQQVDESLGKYNTIVWIPCAQDTYHTSKLYRTFKKIWSCTDILLTTLSTRSEAFIITFKELIITYVKSADAALSFLCWCQEHG